MLAWEAQRLGSLGLGMRLILLSTAVLIQLMLTALGAEARDGRMDEFPPWAALVARQPAREGVPVMLEPIEGRNGSRISGPRVFVTVRHDGVAVALGEAWKRRIPGRVLVRLRAGAREHERILLHVDRVVGWHHVMNLIRQLVPLAPSRVGFDFFRWPDARDHALVGSWTRSAPGKKPASIYEFVVIDGWWTLRSGSVTWRLARASAPLSSSRGAVAETSRIWKEIATHVSSRPTEVARIAIDKSAKGLWSVFMTALVDTLIDAKIRRFEFVNSSLVFSLDPVQGRQAARPRDRWNRRVPQISALLNLAEARIAVRTKRGPKTLINVLRDGSLRVQGATIRSRDLRRVAAAGDPLFLHADRNAPWRSILQCLEFLVAGGAETIGIYVSRWPDLRDHHKEIKWTTGPGQAGATLTLRLDESGFSAALGEEVWRVPPTLSRFDDSHYVRQANQVWDELADSLSIQKPKIVAIQAGQGTSELWLAHLVTILDILETGGVESVWFKQQNLIATFSTR